MKVFIVYAHSDPTSFNGAMFRIAQETLREAGHEVRVSDLYEMGFNPVPGFHDVTAPVGDEIYQIQVEQKNASENGTYAEDVVAEQEKVEWADLVIMQYPIWWFNVPAIVKGWIDRVLTFGWAYGRNERFDSGRLRGKRALVSVTTGSPAVRFGEGSLIAPIEQIIYPVTVGTLQYVGMDLYEPSVAFGVSRATDEERQAILDRFRDRLRGIEQETPMPFHSISVFPDPLNETLAEPESIQGAPSEWRKTA